MSWIRHRDLHLLTVGKETYTPDGRFQSVHNPHTDDWALKVRCCGAQSTFAAFFWWKSKIMPRLLVCEKYGKIISSKNHFTFASFPSRAVPEPSPTLNFLLKFIRKAFCLFLIIFRGPLTQPFPLPPRAVILFTIIHKLQSGLGKLRSCCYFTANNASYMSYSNYFCLKCFRTHAEGFLFMPKCSRVSLKSVHPFFFEVLRLIRRFSFWSIFPPLKIPGNFHAGRE